MVILNFAAREQDGCVLSLPTSQFPPGDYAVQALLTGVDAEGLTIRESGGFTDFAPTEVFPPREGYILLIGARP
ncbi:MAG: hypothetical protein R6X31_00120 [Anaerolineae bacterium]